MRQAFLDKACRRRLAGLGRCLRPFASRIYVVLEWPVILPSLSAAASARADIVDARWLGRGEGRCDDSTRLAYLASSRYACQTVGWPVPVRHNPDGIGDRDGPGLLLPLRPIPGTGDWPAAGAHAAVSAARA